MCGRGQRVEAQAPALPPISAAACSCCCCAGACYAGATPPRRASPEEAPTAENSATWGTKNVGLQWGWGGGGGVGGDRNLDGVRLQATRSQRVTYRLSTFRLATGTSLHHHPPPQTLLADLFASWPSQSARPPRAAAQRPRLLPLPLPAPAPTASSACVREPAARGAPAPRASRRSRGAAPAAAAL